MLQPWMAGRAAGSAPLCPPPPLAPPLLLATAVPGPDRPSQAEPDQGGSAGQQPGPVLAKRGGGEPGFTLDPEPDPCKIVQSLTYYPTFFQDQDISQIEAWIDDTVARGGRGELAGEHTVDLTPFRGKYFFGYGYTYGRGMRGSEELLPAGSVCEIPQWVYWLVVRPLEECGILPPGWVDSVVMNDYRAGSSIVAHVDPPRLFARPIVTVSFFHPARLVFGASFDPERKTPPAHIQELSRGSVLLLDGYAANRVTHGIRPEDLQGTRRVSLILRHVIPGAPGYPAAVAPGAFIGEYAMKLLAQVQGYWRDPPGNRRSKGRYYLVQGMLVTVLLSAREGGKAAAARRSSAPFDVWQLTPTGEGLVLGGGLLEQRGISHRALFWRSISEVLDGWGGRAPKNGSFMWVRAEE